MLNNIALFFNEKESDFLYRGFNNFTSSYIRFFFIKLIILIIKKRIFNRKDTFTLPLKLTEEQIKSIKSYKII